MNVRQKCPLPIWALGLCLALVTPVCGATISSLQVCVGGTCSSDSDYSFTDVALGGRWFATGEVVLNANSGDTLDMPLTITVKSLTLSCAGTCDALTAWITIGIETDASFASLVYNTSLASAGNVGLVIEENFAEDGSTATLVDRAAAASYSFTSSTTTGSSVLDGLVSLGFALSAYGSSGGANSTEPPGVLPVTVGTVNNLVLSVDSTATPVPEPAQALPLAACLTVGVGVLIWRRRRV